MASRNYSDTVPASTIVGPGSGAATGLTNATTTMELSAPISGGISTFPFALRLEPGTSNEEVVLVTAGAGTSGSPYTITRAQGTTTAKAHTTGSAVSHGIYSTDLSDLRTHYDTGVAQHGMSASQKLNGSYIAKTSATTANNTTTETSLHSATIPANEGVAGSLYRITVFGVLGNVVTTAPTVTFTLKYGGTSMATAVLKCLTTAQTNRPFKVTGELVLFANPGSGATWHANLLAICQLDSTASTASTAFEGGSTSAIATGSQVNQTFEVTATWSAANASNVLSANSGIIERIY